MECLHMFTLVHWTKQTVVHSFHNQPLHFCTHLCTLSTIMSYWVTCFVTKPWESVGTLRGLVRGWRIEIDTTLVTRNAECVSMGIVLTMWLRTFLGPMNPALRSCVKLSGCSLRVLSERVFPVFYCDAMPGAKRLGPLCWWRNQPHRSMPSRKTWSEHAETEDDHQTRDKGKAEKFSKMLRSGQLPPQVVHMWEYESKKVLRVMGLTLYNLGETNPERHLDHKDEEKSLKERLLAQRIKREREIDTYRDRDLDRDRKTNKWREREKEALTHTHTHPYRECLERMSIYMIFTLHLTCTHCNRATKRGVEVWSKFRPHRI